MQATCFRTAQPEIFNVHKSSVLGNARGNAKVKTKRHSHAAWPNPGYPSAIILVLQLLLSPTQYHKILASFLTSAVSIKLN